jgi:hypothetical protein
MRQIDQVHDAEHQRQPGRHQEQHDAELQPVQPLLDKQQRAHRVTPSRRANIMSPSAMPP